MDHTRQFASDTHAGVCPAAWAAMTEANRGHAPAYGDDPWSAEARRLLGELLETEAAVFFAGSGTVANSLCLAQLCPSFGAVLGHEGAHIMTDECGAPHFFTHGASLWPIAGAAAKVTPAAVRDLAAGGRGVHWPLPRVLSLTQATELGTVYTPDELRALCDTAHELGLRVHLDGARFANAVASLGVSPKELSWQAGVDVLVFGGSKNGLAGGEAIVFFDRQLADGFDRRLKQSGQLPAKLRFVTAGWVGLLRDGAWLANARHANAMAALLEQRLLAVPGVRLAAPRQSSGLFVHLPDGLADRLHERGWHFYELYPGIYRLLCSWDTTPEDVEAFAADLP